VAAVATACEETPEPHRPGVSLFDLVSGFSAKALADGEHEINRAVGQTGRLRVSVEVDMSRGHPKWHRSAVWFDRVFTHEGR
jgi:hypothetical protein